MLLNFDKIKKYKITCIESDECNSFICRIFKLKMVYKGCWVAHFNKYA